MAAWGAAQLLRPSTPLRAAPSKVEGRERIDDETVDEPSTMMDESSRSMAEHIIQSVSDRFERRLTEEISRIDRRLTEEIATVRVQMHEGFGVLRAEMHHGDAGLRAEMHKGFGELRAEIAAGGERITRWACVFWVGQMAGFVGLLAFLR